MSYKQANHDRILLHFITILADTFPSCPTSPPTQGSRCSFLQHGDDQQRCDLRATQVRHGSTLFHGDGRFSGFDGKFTQFDADMTCASKWLRKNFSNGTSV
jgi:hypothetical protein